MAGLDAEKFLLTLLFQSLDFKDPKVQNGTKENAKTQFLTQHLTSSSNHSNFVDYFAQVNISFPPSFFYSTKDH